MPGTENNSKQVKVYNNSAAELPAGPFIIKRAQELV